MRHERVRELADAEGNPTGTYHWVGTQDCRIRKCPGHPTEQAARECQYEYELAHATKRTVDSAYECRECKVNGKPKVWTDIVMQLGGYMTPLVHLCEEHCTVEVLRKHTEPASERWVS